MVTAEAVMLEVLVEEQSAEAALETLPPVLVPGHDFRIRLFAGKPDLLRNLPDRMRGYARRHDLDRLRILVLIDEDREACTALKERMERAAADAGLVTKSAARGAGRFTVVNRIVVEELAAWYLGDLDALRVAYPGLPPSLHNRRGFRDPDAVSGGTAEALFRELRRAGYFTGVDRLPKIHLARQIAPPCFRIAIAAVASPSSPTGSEHWSTSEPISALTCRSPGGGGRSQMPAHAGAVV